MRLSNRMNTFDAYLGTAMNLILTKMRTEGKDVINLGLGDPDVQPPEHLRRALADACLDVNHHHYPSFYSPRPLKEAMANWYQRRFGSVLDPETEVLPLLGSAEGLFHIHSCLLDPGDVALVPDPAYPAYAAGVAIAGGVAVKVPLLEENDFLPDLSAIPQDVARQAKMIWVNYPNNPTAAVADKEFFARVVDFCKEHQIVAVHDAARPCTPPDVIERVFDAARGMGAEVRDRPVGIVYHTSESDIWPLEESFNEKLRDSSQNLLHYLKKNHVYHYLIDRFGRLQAEGAAHRVQTSEAAQVAMLEESFLA